MLWTFKILNCVNFIIQLGLRLLHITSANELMKNMSYFVDIEFHLNDAIMNKFS
jgi:hypothetical protein